MNAGASSDGRQKPSSEPQSREQRRAGSVFVAVVGGGAKIKDQRPRKKETFPVGLLLEELERVRPGEHLCCIYRSKGERNSVLVAFLLAGLKKNEKCLCVLDESTEEEIIQEFHKEKVDVENYLRSKQLEFFRAEEAYLKEGYFDPDRTVEMIRLAEAAAIKEGYTGLRGAAEASWSLRKLPGSERQMEYEAKISQLLPRSRITALCLYSEKKFSLKALIDAICLHPKIILSGIVGDNPACIRPEDFLAGERGEATREVYRRIRDTIAERMRLARERELAQEHIKRTQEYLELIIERMPIGLIVWDKDFRVRTWNAAATKILGFSREEALGKHPYEFMVPREVQPQTDEIWRRLLQGDQTAHSINENLTKDGRTIVCEWTNTPLREADGTVVGVLSMFQDITERKRAEEALRESEERFRMLVETMNEGLCVLDEKGNITYVNERFCKMMGYSREELIGRRLIDFVDSEYVKVFEENFTRARKGERTSYELVRVRKDGRKIHTITSVAPVFDKEGRFKGSFAVVTDITELKKMEQSLRESELKYSTIVEKGNDGIVIVQDGLIKFVNEWILKTTGFTAEEVIGKRYFNFISPSFRKLAAERYEKRMAGEKVPERYELELLSKDGRSIPFEISASVIEYEGRPANLAILRDITERKLAQKRSRELIYRIYNITPGDCYLIQSQELAYRLFAQLLLHEVPGLCLSRERPDKLLQYGIPKDKMVIISGVPVAGFESVDDLQKVGIRISEFIRENKESVVLLGGLEYLISRFGFESVYKFLQEKRFSFMEARANLLLPIDLATLSEKERALLVSELRQLGQ